MRQPFFPLKEVLEHFSEILDLRQHPQKDTAFRSAQLHSLLPLQ